MTYPTTDNPAGNLVDRAAQTAENAIESTQRAANRALDGLAGSVQDLRAEAAPMISRATHEAAALMHRGTDAIREGSHQLQEHVHHASDSSVAYIRKEPIKSVLIAAAAGAAIMALVSALNRRN